MTSCTPIQNLMTPFIEGKLGPDDEKTVWQHIDSCKACMEDYQQSLFLTHLLKDNMTLPEPPAALRQSVARAVSRPSVELAHSAPAAPAARGARRRR
jgi:anti-sigma factor RsiW